MAESRRLGVSYIGRRDADTGISVTAVKPLQPAAPDLEQTLTRDTEWPEELSQWYAGG